MRRVFATPLPDAARVAALLKREELLTPLPDAARVAALLKREELLIEQSHHLDRASNRQRSQIEAELAAIHRLLLALGLRPKDAG